MERLLEVLDRQQEAMGTLLFRLLEARGLLAQGEARFLHLAARDLEAAAETVREIEAQRSLLAESTAPLRELADAAGSPIDHILHEHRVALGRLAAELAATIEAIEALATDAIAHMEAGSPTRPGVLRRSSQPADDLDLEILLAGYRAVLAASGRLTLPSFVAFLG
jgi:hypothetical protein